MRGGWDPPVAPLAARTSLREIARNVDRRLSPVESSGLLRLVPRRQVEIGEAGRVRGRERCSAVALDPLHFAVGRTDGPERVVVSTVTRVKFDRSAGHRGSGISPREGERGRTEWTDRRYIPARAIAPRFNPQ